MGADDLCWGALGAESSLKEGSPHSLLEASGRIRAGDTRLTADVEGLVVSQADRLKGSVLSSRPTVGVKQHLGKRNRAS